MRWFYGMGFVEVQTAVEQWSPDEQDRLAAFLTVLRLRRDPEYLKEVDRRLDDNDPSHWLTLKELHEKLSDT